MKSRMRWIVSCLTALSLSLAGSGVSAARAQATRAANSEIPQVLSGVTYYVSTTGSNSNPGTISQPWKTIQKAVNNAKPGDTILVRAGTYSESVAFTRSGSSGLEITLKNYPGETVKVSGGTNMALYSKGRVQYWVIEGLKIVSTNRFTVRFGWFYEAYTDHITLRNNYVKGAVFTVGNYQLFENNEVNGTGYTTASYGGINDSHGGLGDNATHHNIYRGNYVHDFTNPYARGIWTQGRTHDNIIEFNRVENIWPAGKGGQCIDLDAGAKGLVEWRHIVRNNTVKDCKYVGIQLENTFASSVENNLVKAEKDGQAGIIAINYDASIGCGVGGENKQYGDTNGDNNCKGDLTNDIIQQNVITKKGAWYYGGIVNWGAGALKIRSNTIYALGTSRNAAILFQASANATGSSVIQNNILYNGNGPAICALSFNSFSKDSYNLLYRANNKSVYGGGKGCGTLYSLAGYQNATGKGQNSVQADPLFVNLTNYDLHLQGTSPAIDKALDVGLTADFEGTPRPQGTGYDLGAYEHK